MFVATMIGSRAFVFLFACTILNLYFLLVSFKKGFFHDRRLVGDSRDGIDMQPLHIGRSICSFSTIAWCCFTENLCPAYVLCCSAMKRSIATIEGCWVLCGFIIGNFLCAWFRVFLFFIECNWSFFSPLVGGEDTSKEPRQNSIVGFAFATVETICVVGK